MTLPQRFCTACGAPLSTGTRFCTACGTPLPVPQGITGPETLPLPAPVPGAGGNGEQVLGIVPFIEQGLISVIRYTLIVTDRQLIFCTWNPDTDEEMSDSEDETMQESCDIPQTKDEIAHFRAKDWADGPWQRYRGMKPEAIIAGAPGSLAIPFTGIADVSIVCENLTSTQDKLVVRNREREIAFDLMYSQGPFLYRILSPLLADRVTIEDHLHRRRGLDRLLSGQEYR